MGASVGAEGAIDGNTLSVGLPVGELVWVAVGSTVTSLLGGGIVGGAVALGPFPAFPFLSDFVPLPALLDFVQVSDDVTAIVEGCSLTEGALEKLGCWVGTGTLGVLVDLSDFSDFSALGALGAFAAFADFPDLVTKGVTVAAGTGAAVAAAGVVTATGGGVTGSRPGTATYFGVLADLVALPDLVA